MTPTVATGRLVARNSVSMLGARVVTAVAGLIALPVLYQQLGPAEFGVWVLLNALFTVLALADLGLGSALVREVARGRHTDWLRGLLALAPVWALCLGLGALAVGTATWPWLSRLLHFDDLACPAGQAAGWLVLGLVAGTGELPWRTVLEGSQRYGSVALISGGTALLGAVATVVVVRLGGGLVGLAASTAGTGVVRAALLALAAHRQFPDLSPTWRRVPGDEVRRIGRYGLRVQVSSAAGAINVELDRFVLGGFFGPATAATFDVGTRLLNLLRLPPGLALIALFPTAVAGAATHGPDWLDRFYLRTTRYLALTVAPGAAILVVGAEPLVRLWLGGPVPWAAANIAVLAPGYAVNLIAGAATVVSRAEGRPGLETRYVLLSVAINLVLTVPLVWLTGPLGVPTATSVAVLVATAYFFLHCHAVTGRPIRPLLRAVRPPVVVAVLAGAAATVLTRGLEPDPGRLGAALDLAQGAGTTLLLAAAGLAVTGDLRPATVRRLAGRLSTLTGGNPATRSTEGHRR